MRLDNKKDEGAAEAGEQKGDEEDIVIEGDGGDVGGEGGSDGGPPLPPHLLLAGGDVSETKNNYSNYERKEKEREAKAALETGGGRPRSKEEIMAALDEGLETSYGWSWDVEHVPWEEQEGAYYEPGFEPWAEQWAAGPGLMKTKRETSLLTIIMFLSRCEKESYASGFTIPTLRTCRRRWQKSKAGRPWPAGEAGEERRCHPQRDQAWPRL